MAQIWPSADRARPDRKRSQRLGTHSGKRATLGESPGPPSRASPNVCQTCAPDFVRFRSRTYRQCGVCGVRTRDERGSGGYLGFVRIPTLLSAPRLCTDGLPLASPPSRTVLPFFVFSPRNEKNRNDCVALSGVCACPAGPGRPQPGSPHNKREVSVVLTAIPRRMHQISSDLRS